MTRTISLIIGISVAALAIAAPALGEGRLAGSQQGVAYFYANERATLAQQPVLGVVSRPDSHDVIAAQPRGSVLISGEDHTGFTPVESSVSDTGSGSGSNIDWQQLGIGLAIGILLALGLVLGVRATRQRQLAH